jgi:Bacterial capsule synthesis protein PGA_cap
LDRTRRLPPPAPHGPATILFGGDMMFDRTIRTTIQAHGGGWVLDCLDPTLESADLVVANLEGPITDNPSQSVGSGVGTPDNFVFTFPTTTAPLLAQHHIGLVNLGNNHILNFGRAGVESTEAALSAAGVGFFGDPVDTRVHTEGVNGLQFAFINYNEYGPAGAAVDASTTIAQIKAAKAAKLIPIVYTHWGIEYATSAPAYVVKRGHEFVDAGAALIVGSSPHVVQEEEVYKGVPIFYSLGNRSDLRHLERAVGQRHPGRNEQRRQHVPGSKPGARFSLNVKVFCGSIRRREVQTRANSQHATPYLAGVFE